MTTTAGLPRDSLFFAAANVTLDSVRKCFLLGVGVSLLLATGGAFAQAPASAPAFEVASVKPSPPLTSLTPAMLQSGTLRVGISVVGARVEAGFMSLTDLVRTAYDVKAYQVSGPDWMAGERFDIAAKLPDGATKDDVNAMLRSLLADRFKLTMHREKKDRPVYALVVGKGGSKLKASVPDPDVAKTDAGKSDAAPPMMVVNGQSVTSSADGRSAAVTGGPTGPLHVSMGPAGEHIEATNITLTAFADMLSPMVDRPVVDMTELKGTYQLTLDIPLAEMMAMAAKAVAAAGLTMPVGPPGASGAGGSSMPVAADPGSNSIFEAVQRLGLRLEPRTGPVDVIMIDHVEKAPTED